MDVTFDGLFHFCHSPILPLQRYVAETFDEMPYAEGGFVTRTFNMQVSQQNDTIGIKFYTATVSSQKSVVLNGQFFFGLLLDMIYCMIINLIFVSMLSIFLFLKSSLPSFCTARRLVRNVW